MELEHYKIEESGDMSNSKGESKQAADWSLRKIRSTTRRTVFTKGVMPYIVLIVVTFILSFATSINSSASKEIKYIDNKIGTGTLDQEDIEAVNDYVVNLDFVKPLDEDVRNELVPSVVSYMAKKHAWVINLLSMNEDYMDRNMGEVVVFQLIVFFILWLAGFIAVRSAEVGKARFMIENCLQKNVKIRRIFAPFGRKKFFHVIRVMSVYITISVLWCFTIIGGVIKFYQYYFVPFILAENPELGWKQARNLSKKMTKGYKMKIFLANLSYIYLLALSMIPFSSLFVSVPITGVCNAEMYLALRKRNDFTPEEKALFIERAFDGDSYVDQVKAGATEEEIQPEYLMPDIMINGKSFDEADKYKLVDFIIMFFLFSFVGWLWEVGIHVVKDHAFVNRGTMYGPWIPIYGAGGAGIIVLLSRFKKNKPKLFVLEMVLCGALEYATSFFLDYINNAEYWNYDDMFGNLNGRVCLAGLLAFALGGFLGIYILGPLIKRFVTWIGPKKTKIVCIILVACFVIDVICCVVIGPNAGEGIGQKLSRNDTFISTFWDSQSLT